MITDTRKPGRPLGVTIAILTSVCVFSLLPLAQVAFLVMLSRHSRFDNTGYAGGTDVLGLNHSTLILQAGLGIIYLVIAVFAWRGRPNYIRQITMIYIVLLMAATIVTNVLPTLTGEPCSTLPCDSSGELRRQLACAQLPIIVLVPLYVLWYLNRGPARAFYRGYFLPAPDDRPDKDESPD
jgi:hypothetical protein